MPAHTSVMNEERELGGLIRPPVGRPELVDVPELLFLAIDGRGDPSTAPEYRAAIECLYAVSYGLKLASKRDGGPDWKVSPLEGLWWVEGQGEGEAPPGGHGDPTGWTGDRSLWRWRALMRQPGHVTEAQVTAALDAAVARRPLGAAGGLRLERFREGPSAQVMHVGPYSAEAPTIERLHAFIAEQGLVPSGRHHEIYLSDPRRAAPERLRTVIRQPVTASIEVPGCCTGVNAPVIGRHG